MRRIAFAFLTAFVLTSLGLLTSPATAGDYYYGDGYDNGYYSDVGYYGHRYNDDGYYRHRYSDDGYYYHHRHYGNTWYTSNCCYRRVVRHTAWYEPTYRYGDYDNGYYHHRYYGDGYYRHPYYRNYYSGYYERPYRYYDLGYNSVGYASYNGCERIPLADGRGGWVWSRRAGCF
jgi:hypothetical protein